MGLRHPATYFPEIAATPTAFVVPPKADASRGWQTVDSFIGSGPYVADSLDDQALVLVANPEYVAGPPPDHPRAMADPGGERQRGRLRR